MRQPRHCACCGRERGDGRRDRGWLYWSLDVYQRRELNLLGPVQLPVAYCPTCYRDEIAPEFEHAKVVAA